MARDATKWHVDYFVSTKTDLPQSFNLFCSCFCKTLLLLLVFLSKPKLCFSFRLWISIRGIMYEFTECIMWSVLTRESARILVLQKVLGRVTWLPTEESSWLQTSLWSWHHCVKPRPQATSRRSPGPGNPTLLELWRRQMKLYGEKETSGKTKERHTLFEIFTDIYMNQFVLWRAVGRLVRVGPISVFPFLFIGVLPSLLPLSASQV